MNIDEIVAMFSLVWCAEQRLMRNTGREIEMSRSKQRRKVRRKKGRNEGKEEQRTAHTMW
jgi:hypothetical protein